MHLSTQTTQACAVILVTSFLLGFVVDNMFSLTISFLQIRFYAFLLQGLLGSLNLIKENNPCVLKIEFISQNEK